MFAECKECAKELTLARLSFPHFCGEKSPTMPWVLSVWFVRSQRTTNKQNKQTTATAKNTKKLTHPSPHIHTLSLFCFLSWLPCLCCYREANTTPSCSLSTSYFLDCLPETPFQHTRLHPTTLHINSTTTLSSLLSSNPSPPYTPTPTFTFTHIHPASAAS